MEQNQDQRKGIELLHWFEDQWVKRYGVISFIFGLVTGVLFYFGYVTNVRNSIGNVVTFASIIIGILGVFLTLLITLQESLVFKRLKEHFPKTNQSLYLWLRSQIWTGMIVVLLSVIISVLPPSPNKALSTIAVVVWSSFFWLMSIGSFYTVKLVADLVVRNFDIPVRKSMSGR